MTRKDYIKLAEIIKDRSYSDGQVNGESRHVLDRGEFMHDLCRMLEDDNPKKVQRSRRRDTRRMKEERCLEKKR